MEFYALSVWIGAMVGNYFVFNDGCWQKMALCGWWGLWLDDGVKWRFRLPNLCYTGSLKTFAKPQFNGAATARR